MSLDSTQVLVAGSAALYIANTGASAPTGLAAPGTAFTAVGYTTDAGATFTLNRQTNSVLVWETLDPIRIITTSATKSVALTMRQWNPANMAFALGGGSSTIGTGTPGGTAYGVYTYPAASENPARAVVLDCVDGSYTVRFYWSNMIVDGSISAALNRTDSLTLPIQLTSLTSTTQPTVTSNAPGWTA